MIRNWYFKNTIFLIILFSGITFCNAPVRDAFEGGGKVIRYISSESFKNLRDNHPQFVLIDSIFKYSLELAEGDIQDGLLFCCLGTLTYSSFEIKIPLLGLPVEIHVFNELDKDAYYKLKKNLPRHLFEDSPKSDYGDLDKLTHFFSSAYLAYCFGNGISEMMGFFVENFEESFEAENFVDNRDLNMNRIGREFGIKLNREIIYPSEILTKYKSLKNG